MSVLRQWTSFIKRLVHVIAKPIKGDSSRGGMVVHPYRGYGSNVKFLSWAGCFAKPHYGSAIPRHGMLRDTADVGTARFYAGGWPMRR